MLVSMNPANNSVSSAKKTPYTKIVLIVILAVIAIPSMLFAAPWVLCDTVVSPQHRKVTELTNKLSTLERQAERVTVSSVKRNGDCITGSGAVGHITIDAQFKNLESARKDVTEIIEKSGNPKPDFSEAIQVSLGNNKIGDSIEILNSEHQYSGTYDITYSLQETTGSCMSGSVDYTACIDRFETGTLPDELRPISGVAIEINLDS